MGPSQAHGPSEVNGLPEAHVPPHGPLKFMGLGVIVPHCTLLGGPAYILSFLLCYTALYNIILKVYFFILNSTGNNGVSTHKLHLMVNMAKILVHPYEK